MKNTVLNAIKKLPENDFTKEVIKPLFEKIGYTKVIFHGGVNENGKDLICWKKDEIGDKEVVTVQVKMKKMSSSSSSNSSFSTVINQLQQASEEHIKNEDGLEYLPTKVYLVTPTPVTARELASRFKPVATNTKLKIIDGDRLFELLNKHMPEYINSIAGNIQNIHKSLISEVNNDELFSALKVSGKLDAVNYYSDLDINYFTKIIKLTSRNKNNWVLCIVSDNDWKIFENKISSLLSINPLFNKIINIEDVEKKYKQYFSKENEKNLLLLKKIYKNFFEKLSILNDTLNDFSKYYLVDINKKGDRKSLENKHQMFIPPQKVKTIFSKI